MNKFDFNSDYILEDEVVLMRPLRADDFENLVHFSTHEPELWRYSMIQADSPDKLKHYIQVALDAKAELKEYPFIVYDKRLGKYAGSTRYYDIQLSHQVLQLGYTWYGSEFHGTGLNKHCKFLLLQFAFETMGMERVEFRADNNNAKSIAAMQSIGCQVEGVLRSNLHKPDGSRRDSIVLSILKSEWENVVKNNLLKRLV
jgi:RimJ/RimL family protein N-acetyltransferase